MTHQQDGIVVRDNVTITVWQGGEILRVERGHNLTTAVGLNVMVVSTRDEITHFALGTSATTVALSDTALGAEVFRDVVSSKAADAATLTVKYFLGTSDANGETLREAGLFTAAGALTARYVQTTPIVKSSDVTVTYVWVLEWEAR